MCQIRIEEKSEECLVTQSEQYGFQRDKKVAKWHFSVVSIIIGYYGRMHGYQNS